MLLERKELYMRVIDAETKKTLQSKAVDTWTISEGLNFYHWADNGAECNAPCVCKCTFIYTVDKEIFAIKINSVVLHYYKNNALSKFIQT